MLICRARQGQRATRPTPPAGHSAKRRPELLAGPPPRGGARDREGLRRRLGGSKAMPAWTRPARLGSSAT
eukprot:4217888-Alexandrium_andersonii.AAC.1